MLNEKYSFSKGILPIRLNSFETILLLLLTLKKTTDNPEFFERLS